MRRPYTRRCVQDQPTPAPECIGSIRVPASSHPTRSPAVGCHHQRRPQLAHRDDPLLLDFDYMRQMVAVIEQRYEPSASLRVLLHLGGAACSLPPLPGGALIRYPAGGGWRSTPPSPGWSANGSPSPIPFATHPRRRRPRGPRIRPRRLPRRSSCATRSSDAVTPDHLTTREFTAHVHRVLAPGGLYLANCGDDRTCAAPALRSPRSPTPSPTSPSSPTRRCQSAAAPATSSSPVPTAPRPRPGSRPPALSDATPVVDTHRRPGLRGSVPAHPARPGIASDLTG